MPFPTKWSKIDSLKEMTTAGKIQVECGISCVRKQVTTKILIGPSQKDIEAS